MDVDAVELLAEGGENLFADALRADPGVGDPADPGQGRDPGQDQPAYQPAPYGKPHTRPVNAPRPVGAEGARV